MAQVDLPNEVDTAQQELSGTEETRWRRFLNRALEDTHTQDTEVVVEKLREYQDEFLVAARVARSQFEQKFGGANPERGQFAVSRIRSGYFGYDSWEGNANLTGMTAGALVNWINDGAPDNLGGTDTSFGNPLKIGDNAVHAIVGFGTYSPSPKISTIAYRINEEPRSTVDVKYEWTNTDTAIKWLDRALILPQDTLFEARVFPDVAGDDAPYPIGLSYIESVDSELADPANMTDDSTSTSDNIVAQG